jgi:phospholipase/carboxylesterase
MLAGLASMPFLGACTRKPEEKVAPTKPAQTLTWPRTTTHAGVEAIELFPSDANETSPVIAAIHGLGDRPQNWVEGWRNFPRKVQVVLPRAFTPHGDGFSWFPFRDAMTEEELGLKVGAAEERLWACLSEIAAGRKLIVTGFSQGGMLSYTMAARRADRIAHAFPVSGFCPPTLVPRNQAPTVPVLAFHGTADHVLPIQWDRDTVTAFKANGSRIELREYEGVGHTITPEMRKDWWLALADAVNAS